MSFNATLERADITYLLRSERHFRDSKKWDDMRACYHPDDDKTLVNISWYVTVRTCSKTNWLACVLIMEML